MSDVAVAVAAVRARIAAAAARAGRRAEEVTLVAAAKATTLEGRREVLAAGVVDLGENRAQELLAVAPALAALAAGAPSPRWHFIGHLQRNKVRALAPWVHLWHTVDRVPLGAAIAAHAPGARVLVEVNLADEPQKSGCAPGEAAALVDALAGLGLDVAGLMTVPPRADDPRRWYAALRDLAFALGVRELSMGMTDDLEIAVEEGATLVRVGRALFGERPDPGATPPGDGAPPGAPDGPDHPREAGDHHPPGPRR